MGKKARLRRERSVPTRTTHTAFVMVSRELRWVLDDPTRRMVGPPATNSAIATAYRSLYRLLPRSRVIRIPPELISPPPPTTTKALAATVAAPFEATFLDLGLATFSEWNPNQMVGALLAGSEGNVEGLVWTRTPNDDQWGVLYLNAAMYASDGAARRQALVDALDERTKYVVEPDAVISRVFGALAILESVNVELACVAGPPRGHQGHGVPHYEVVIRRAGTRYLSNERPSVSSQWSHQWEVRGHFKHFRRGPLFDKYPERRVSDGTGNECIRVWCPPHIKGPADMPLIPKVRRVAV